MANDRRFPKASHYLPVENSQVDYSTRVMRNRFWLGGDSGQKTIRDLKIAVAGLGGMGSHIAELLVRLGVGHVRVADPDIIEATNLNRQVIANRNTLGKSKVEASIQELRSIATDFELIAYNDGVNEKNVDEFVAGCDAVVDEIDVFPMNVHVQLHQAARRHKLPIYSAYVVGLGIHFYKFEGEAYTFEDFLGGEANRKQWEKPSAQFLLDRIGYPFRSYLDKKEIERYRVEIESSGAPIFGPATLFGHSTVVTRLLLDLMRKRNPQAIGTLASERETPVMPKFLVLDPVEMSFRESKID